MKHLSYNLLCTLAIITTWYSNHNDNIILPKRFQSTCTFTRVDAFSIIIHKQRWKSQVYSGEIDDTISSSSSSTLPSSSTSSSLSQKWTHSDIEWRLEPSEDTPLVEKLKLKAAAKAVRAECMMKDQPVPPVLCPKGGKAVLEAFDNRNSSKNQIPIMGGKKRRIGKFGITTTRGPPAVLLDETIKDIYDVTPPINGAGVAAIIYMYVEPEYRKLGIGELALEAIAAIQIVQGCDFTVLVADDDGSNKLVAWYEKNGFSIAPKLQEMFGSPGGKYGVTMIRPTQVASDIFARCQIKWW